MSFANLNKKDCYKTFYGSISDHDEVAAGDYPGNLAEVLSCCGAVEPDDVPVAMSRLALHKRWLLLMLYGNENRMSIRALSGLYKLDEKRRSSYMSLILHQRVAAALSDLYFLVSDPDAKDATTLTTTRVLQLPYPQNLWLAVFETPESMFMTSTTAVDIFVGLHEDDSYYLTCLDMFQSSDASLRLNLKRFLGEFRDFVFSFELAAEVPEDGLFEDVFEDALGDEFVDEGDPAFYGSDCWDDVGDDDDPCGFDYGNGYDDDRYGFEPVDCDCYDDPFDDVLAEDDMSDDDSDLQCSYSCHVSVAKFDVGSTLGIILDEDACIVLRHLANGRADLARIFTDDVVPDVMRIMRSYGCTRFESTGEEVGSETDDVVNLFNMLKERCTSDQLAMLAKML